MPLTAVTNTHSPYTLPPHSKAIIAPTPYLMHTPTLVYFQNAKQTNSHVLGAPVQIKTECMYIQFVQLLTSHSTKIKQLAFRRVTFNIHNMYVHVCSVQMGWCSLIRMHNECECPPVSWQPAVEGGEGDNWHGNTEAIVGCVCDRER